MSESTILAPSGDLTIFEVSEFRQTLQDQIAAAHSVTLDFTHTGKIDASGLQLIMAAQRCGTVTLRGLSPATLEDLSRLGWEQRNEGAT